MYSRRGRAESTHAGHSEYLRGECLRDKRDPGGGVVLRGYSEYSHGVLGVLLRGRGCLRDEQDPLGGVVLALLHHVRADVREVGFVVQQLGLPPKVDVPA
jgi:hypothetical protein